MSPRQPTFKRILLKLSGEALMGSQTHGIDPQTIATVGHQIKQVHDLGVQIAIVVGGGNIFRGMASAAQGMERTTGDYMGMLATVINSLALGDGLEKAGMEARVMTALPIHAVAESYSRREALHHLESGRVLIFAAGTGSPYFTTDTAASLRAVEINADIIMKATKVDGIYTDDPVKNPNAILIERITYLDVVARQLKVMDTTAITLCMDNHLPILVFNMTMEGNIIKAVMGEPIGTLVEEG